MQRIIAKLPASYTFTGNARQASFGVTSSENLETHALSCAGADLVRFKSSYVRIVRARLIPSGAVGLAPANEKIAAKVQLKFSAETKSSDVFTLSFSKWDEWERQDVNVKLDGDENDSFGLAVVQSNTEFTCDDFNISDAFIGQDVIPLIEIEFEEVGGGWIHYVNV